MNPLWVKITKTTWIMRHSCVHPSLSQSIALTDLVRSWLWALTKGISSRCTLLHLRIHGPYPHGACAGAKRGVLDLMTLRRYFPIGWQTPRKPHLEGLYCEKRVNSTPCVQEGANLLAVRRGRPSGRVAPKSRQLKTAKCTFEMVGAFPDEGRFISHD